MVLGLHCCAFVNGLDLLDLVIVRYWLFVDCFYVLGIKFHPNCTLCDSPVTQNKFVIDERLYI